MAALALLAGVEQALQWHRYDDAVFLAERLHAEQASDRTLVTLGEAYIRAGRHGSAYAILKGSPLPQARMLFATSCLSLERLQEGELALTGALFPGTSTTLNDLNNTHGAAFTLLGKICLKSQRTEQAAECFRKAVEQNPYCWSAFEALCQLGKSPTPDTIFTAESAAAATAGFSLTGPVSSTALPASAAPSSHEPMAGAAAASASAAVAATPVAAAGGSKRTLEFGTPVSSQLLLASPLSMAKPLARVGKGETPTTPGVGLFSLAGGSVAVPSMSSLGTPSPSNYITPPNGAAGGPPPRRFIEAVPRKLSSRLSQESHITPADEAPIRRSARLFTGTATSIPVPLLPQSAGAPSSVASSVAASTVKGRAPVKEVKGKPKAGAKRSLEDEQFAPPPALPAHKPVVEKKQRAKEGSPEATHESESPLESAAKAMELLRILGKATQALALYKCHDVVEILTTLPSNHFHTGWVQCQIGKAYFELANYKNAEGAFRMARRVSPHDTQGLATFSTVLWHLRQETPLSYLAHEAVAADRLSPEAWCVVGNCFSLQKEHDMAVKFFERAVQLDPSFTYAYTLLGHEYVYNEDFAKALSCFRNALRYDPRHYNAWYGLGMIYFRQEKYDLAERHFHKASSINPASPVLLCYLGMALQAQKKSTKALEMLDRAGKIAPENPLVKFNKAMVLFSMNRNEEALEELTELKRIAPQESSVYFLMGKIHKKLGNNDKAMLYFAWAMDLDPKGSNNLIKEAIDRNHIHTGDEEEQQEEPISMQGSPGEM